MPRDSDSSPKIPIPGAAAEIIRTALARMAAHCGEYRLTISKERLPGGGYSYSVANHEPPARPVMKP